MKKSVIFFLMISLFSCGNPHVSSDNEPSVTPTLESQTGQTTNSNEENDDDSSGEDTNESSKVIFFIGDRDDRNLDLSLRSDDLNSLPLGVSDSIILNFDDLDIMLTHRTEERLVVPELKDLFSVYSEESFDLSVLEPISTDEVQGEGRGIDTFSYDALTKDVLLVEFSRPVKSFSGIFLDLESTVFLPGIMRVFDCDGQLIASKEIIYPDGTDGDEGFHTLGFRAVKQEICSFGVTVGDLLNRTGVYKSVALDEIAFE